VSGRILSLDDKLNWPRESAVLNVVGTVGKALAALLAAGAIAAVAGKGGLATVLLVLGALGGAVGVVADARSKTVQQREAPLVEPSGRPPNRDGLLGAAPRRTSRYVARGELERLVEALVRADGRPVALVGMAGSGKTVLAIEAVYAKRVRQRFTGGLAWLAVGPRPDIPAMQSDLAGRLGGRDQVFRDPIEGRAVLGELSSNRKVLVVLDNVWERAAIDAFGPEYQILFTSRFNGLAHDLNAT
jgi:hypothetical protein